MPAKGGAQRTPAERCTAGRRPGQFDAALRIHRDEELSVYERLGDARSKAVTMFRIAEILQTHGQLDEARRYADDAREIFARLQDPAGIAHCDDLLGRITAAGRAARG
jgi:hypothetical protein